MNALRRLRKGHGGSELTSVTEYTFQGRKLPTEWADYLRDRAITPAVAAARGYQAVRKGKAIDGDFAAVWGFSKNVYGLLVPLHGLLEDTSGGKGSAVHQLRLDEAYLQDHPKSPRFLSPKGQMNVLSTSPITRNRLKEAKEVIIIAEGVTRVDAVAGFEIPAVGISGVHSWKSGRPSVALADFDALGIKGNRFIVAVDGDAKTNKSVHRALNGINRLLKGKGADLVLVLDVPGGLGLDDWFAQEDFPDKKAAMEALQEYSRESIKAPRQVPVVVGDTFPVGDAGPWSCTPAGDVVRLLQHKPKEICVVRGMAGGEWGLLVVQKGGRWTSVTDHSAIGHLHMSSALDWQRRVSEAVIKGDLHADQAGACTRHAVTSCKAAGIRELLGMLGASFRYMQAHSLEPDGLTVCDAADLDKNPDRRYLGAPNGVIDLNTGDLLPAAEARQKFITRHIPDDYQPGASHEYAAQLVGHLAPEDREYLLAALGYALRGNVSRRVYGLAGERGGAKSTLFSAVLAAIGLARSEGYGLRLDPESLVKSSWGRGGNAHHGNLMGLQDARIAFCEEPPESRTVDAQLLNDLSGGAPAALRDVGAQMRPERPVTASIFLGFNPGQEEFMDVSNNALNDRARLLRYPRLNVTEIPDRINDVAQLVEVRQAVVAMLVSAAVRHQTRPTDPPSVQDYSRERYEDAIGPVGQHIARYLRVTGKREDVLDADDLIAAIEQACGGQDKDGLVDGLDRKAILQRAREVLASKSEKLPRMSRAGGGKRVYRGVRLLDDADLDAESMAEYEVPVDGQIYCQQCPKLVDEGRELCPDCEEKSRGGPTSGGPAAVTTPATLSVDAQLLNDLSLTEVVAERVDQLTYRRNHFVLFAREDWALYGAMRGVAAALNDNKSLMPPQVVAFCGGPVRMVDKIAALVTSPEFIAHGGATTNGEYAAHVEQAAWTEYFMKVREIHARESEQGQRGVALQLREFLAGVWQSSLPWGQ